MSTLYQKKDTILLYNTNLSMAQNRCVLLEDRASEIGSLATSNIPFGTGSKEIYGKCSLLNNASINNTNKNQSSCPCSQLFTTHLHGFTIYLTMMYWYSNTLCIAPLIWHHLMFTQHGDIMSGLLGGCILLSSSCPAPRILPQSPVWGLKLGRVSVLSLTDVN